VKPKLCSGGEVTREFGAPRWAEGSIYRLGLQGRNQEGKKTKARNQEFCKIQQNSVNYLNLEYISF
jgi:hypothetical protein